MLLGESEQLTPDEATTRVQSATMTGTRSSAGEESHFRRVARARLAQSGDREGQPQRAAEVLEDEGHRSGGLRRRSHRGRVVLRTPGPAAEAPQAQSVENDADRAEGHSRAGHDRVE